MENIKKITATVQVACFAALIAACSVFVLPLGPVPFTLQTMAVALAGMLLGSKRGVLAVLLYVLAGIAGAPVFAGGRTGMAVLFGPTCGYLAGFAAMAALCGMAKPKRPVWNAALWLITGLCALHLCGLAGICLSLGRTPTQALLMDAAFIPGDLLKSLAALFIWRSLERKSDDRCA